MKSASRTRARHSAAASAGGRSGSLRRSCEDTRTSKLNPSLDRRLSLPSSRRISASSSRTRLTPARLRPSSISPRMWTRVSTSSLAVAARAAVGAVGLEQTATFVGAQVLDRRAGQLGRDGDPEERLRRIVHSRSPLAFFLRRDYIKPVSASKDQLASVLSEGGSHVAAHRRPVPRASTGSPSRSSAPPTVLRSCRWMPGARVTRSCIEFDLPGVARRASTSTSSATC